MCGRALLERARVTSIGWLDASSGISGDMLLGALVDAGVPIDVLQSQLNLLAIAERIELTAENVIRGGLAATLVTVETAETTTHRRLTDVLALLDPLEMQIRTRASDVFRTLAAAEARVHRMTIGDVHFHEVGALDSIADIVGVVAGISWLGLDRLVCSPIALGGGRAATAHGSIPVPVPAVLELLATAAVPAHGGPLDRELATPTGVALAVTIADSFGPMPALIPDQVATGAGTWNPEDHANVVRLVLGTAEALDNPALEAPGNAALEAPDNALLLEANVDDMDPRLWPGVISALLTAGAADAWVTPIVMKKGRPAHTVSVLAAPDLAGGLGRLLLQLTSTIGLRRRTVEKVALPRETVTVRVDGAAVRLKIARLNGEIVNVSAEFDDIARVAAQAGRPEKQILAGALHEAHRLGFRPGGGN
jgi:uncharacterized protein (TIGR00299 family) protein